MYSQSFVAQHDFDDFMPIQDLSLGYNSGSIATIDGQNDIDEDVDIDEDLEIDEDLDIDEDLEIDEDVTEGVEPSTRLQSIHNQVAEFESWKVIVIDDEPSVHQATRLALKNFTFEGKSLELISAYSGAEGKELITKIHSEIAFVLLDVVMEASDSGLNVVRYIREELHNHQVRIILRTGQPGEAPEESVILNYDINAYQLKVELTRQRLLTTVISALRSFRDIVTLERQRQQLAVALDRLQRMQSQLQDYSYNLEIKVSQRTAELEQANRDLLRLANLDGLTGVANRRCFDDYLRKQWQQLELLKQPISLLIVDVDYFKPYNDYYGHQAGDECLKQLAQTLSSLATRPQDLVARYGGEEFVILLPNTPIEGACKIAETILNRLRQQQLPHLRSQVAQTVTVSMGISWLIPEPETSLDSLIEMADRALYQAKQAGRDRHCTYASIADSTATQAPA
jgi:diguanylate cyclase (GGDEF)-like protein